jgi:hypothetical protein
MLSRPGLHLCLQNLNSLKSAPPLVNGFSQTPDKSIQYEPSSPLLAPGMEQGECCLLCIGKIERILKTSPCRGTWELRCRHRRSSIRRMVRSQKHISLIRVFLAALVLTASSGATIVLHRCQMQTTCCCSPIRSTNGDGCNRPNGASSGKSFKADFTTCNTSIVVGGVALKQALLEKENKPESNKAIVSKTGPLSLGSLLQTDRHSQYLLLSKAVSPPSVDRYVLNGSFLI